MDRFINLRRFKSAILILMGSAILWNCNIGIGINGSEPGGSNAREVPATIDLITISETQIDLNWQAFQGESVESYRIYRNDSAVGDTSELFYSDTGLTPVSQYRYTIVALDGQGNEVEQSPEFIGSTTHIYYINPISGSDENTGTSVEEPWKSFINLTSYYHRYFDIWPQNARPLEEGDIVYIMEGSVSTPTSPGDDNGGPNVGGHRALLYLRNVHASEEAPIHFLAYPGHNPILDPNYAASGVVILDSSWIEFSGIDVTRSMAVGEGGNFDLSGVDHFTLSHSEVSHADGSDNNNVSGLNCSGSSNVTIHHCIFHDNYDRAALDTGGISTANSTNMVFFGGENITVHDCLIYQTPSPDAETNSGAGIKYKHSTRNPQGTFEVYNNVFRNCKFFSLQTGSANSYVHHNIIIGGNVPLHSLDCGGPTHQINQIFEFNTIYNPVYFSDHSIAESAFHYHPTTAWRNEDFPNDPQNIRFRNNIVVQTGDYTAEHYVIGMNAYIDDDMFNIAIPEFFIDSNVYYNTGGVPLSFGLASSTSYGALGGLYTFDEWKALTWTDPVTGLSRNLNYDQNGINTDPQFLNIDENLDSFDDESDFFRPAANSSAAAMGAYAGR